MTRQRLGEKKVRALRDRLGLPIVGALVRGNTGHRIDLCLDDGSITHYWPDSGEMLDTGARHALSAAVEGSAPPQVTEGG